MEPAVQDVSALVVKPLAAKLPVVTRAQVARAEQQQAEEEAEPEEGKYEAEQGQR